MSHNPWLIENGPSDENETGSGDRAGTEEDGGSL
jgi:hypothetical protein